MKGVFDLLPTIAAVLFTLIGFTLLYAGFFASRATINTNLVYPGFEKLGVIDLTHNAVFCLSENKLLESESLQQKLEECREKLGINYIEVIDIENGNKLVSGKQDGRNSHSDYTNNRHGEGLAQARIYVRTG